MRSSIRLAPFFLLLLVGCRQNVPTVAPLNSAPLISGQSSTRSPSTRNASTKNDNRALGNPSAAARDANNLLLERPQHAMSYNASNGGPNWVAWHLDQNDLGSARRSQFMPDPMLPAALQIRPNDYRGAGYDRGHVCPSGDRTRDSAFNQGTFVMSNMLPQAAALNRQVWRKLEEYERTLAKSGNELYIVAGGAGSISRIGGKINIPDVCWKILVVLPNGDNDLARINSSTRVIAVSMPNRDRAEIGQSQWAQWITTPAQIERTTGLKFFTNLPSVVRNALEAKKDSGRATASRAGRNLADSSATPMPQMETTRAPVGSAPTVASGEKVWVNTKTGVYHMPGTRWYGATKEGQYMERAAADAAGYHAAKNGE